MPDLYRANCPHCGVAFNYQAVSAGTMRRCEACSQKFMVPHLTATPDNSKAKTWLGCGALVVVLAIIGLCAKAFGLLPDKPPETPRRSASSPQQTPPRS